jgi:hypothetical protein
MADPDGFSYLNNGRLASAYLILNDILQFIFYFRHFTLFGSESVSHKDTKFTKKNLLCLGVFVGEKFYPETLLIFSTRLVPGILN